MTEAAPAAAPNLPTPSKAEFAPSVPASREGFHPRNIVFGAIEVREAIDKDFLSLQERQVFQFGFNNLENMLGKVANPVERMVLTNPDMVSGIVGWQPAVGVGFGEAAVFYQAFERTGKVFDQEYSLFDFGHKGTLQLLVNNTAAENKLRIFQNELGIELPNEELTPEQLGTYIVGLLNEPDPKRANLAHGLLSGFPIEDVKYWVENADVRPVPEVKSIDNIEARFTQERGLRTLGRTIRLDPLPFLDISRSDNRSREHAYFRDTRAEHQNGNPLTVEGYGLRWITTNPPSQEAMEKCQQLLQVDRELGLTELIEKQRGAFDVEENLRLINNSRKLLKFL